MMRPVMAVLRHRGVRCMIFIDDMLLLHSSASCLTDVVTEVATMLLHLGLRMNWEKSSPVPSHRKEFLGFVIN